MTAGEMLNELMAMPLRSDIVMRTAEGEKCVPIRSLRLENGYGLPFLQGVDSEAVIVVEGVPVDG